MKLISSIKTKWQERQNRLLFKKHNVSSWRAYNLLFDPAYCARANSIRRMFHGYPYIAEINDSSKLVSPQGRDWIEGYRYLKTWLEEECRGKARATIERTLREYSPGKDGEPCVDWQLNEFCSDSAFIAFQDERDYMIFLLKWETD